ncbi:MULTISPECIES: hypothetical protein, partial [unclassified Methanosarcina]|uniref:hypothetical protein n=1 Tax=unclassified Methanosarcina TaxID=2644672 RepID=UPI00064E8125
VCGLARVLKKDIDACFESDVGLVHTFVPTSEVQRIYTIKYPHLTNCLSILATKAILMALMFV